MSTILNKSSIRTINRLGDMMLPKAGGFPSFSETGCIEHIDDIITYAPEEDISGLNTLLSILSVCPDFALKFILKNMETSHSKNNPASYIFRQLDFGLKGIIFTCYYSGKTGKNYKGENPMDIIGFRFNRVMD